MAIAISEPVVEFISNADASSYTHTSSYTPTANSLQIIFVGATGTVLASPTISGGSGWTTAPALQATKGDWNAGANTIYCFVGLAGASPGSFTCTFDCTGDAATGCTMSFFQVTGAATSSYVVQMAAINSVIGANPTFTFGASLNTNNGYCAAICNTANPAAVTPPTSWTETVDSGHTSPTTGIWAGYRAGGETGTTVTATKASSTHGGLAIEIAVATGAYTITAASGSYAITGNATGLKASRQLVATAGSYAITGNATGLAAGRKIAATAGSYAITGNAVALKAARQLVATAGSYAVTGNAVALKTARQLVAAAGVYALTGNDVTLTYTPAVGAYTLTAESGIYTLTGNAATLTYQSSTSTRIDTFAETEEIHRKYPLKDEVKRKRLKKSEIRKVKAVASENAPSKERIAELFTEIIPYSSFTEDTPVIEALQAQILESLNRLGDEVVLHQHREREHQRLLTEAIAKQMQMLEDDEVLLLHLM